jgi:hypothetical protein
MTDHRKRTRISGSPPSRGFAGRSVGFKGGNPYPESTSSRQVPGRAPAARSRLSLLGNNSAPNFPAIALGGEDQSDQRAERKLHSLARRLAKLRSALAAFQRA